MAGRDQEAEIPKVIFDTDVLIWYLRGNAKASAFIRKVGFEDRNVSSLAVMELIQGCADKKELSAVRSFLSENFSRTIHPDAEISELAIRLMEKYFLSHGLRIVDSLIAATAQSTGASLASADSRHYKSIEGLRLIRFRP